MITLQVYHIFVEHSITKNDQDVPDNGRAAVHGDKEWMRLAHCHIFANALRGEKFANAAIDAVIERMTISDRYPTGIAGKVSAHTAAGNNLRALLVNLHVWKGKGAWIKPPHDDTNAPAGVCCLLTLSATTDIL